MIGLHHRHLLILLIPIRVVRKGELGQGIGV